MHALFFENGLIPSVAKPSLTFRASSLNPGQDESTCCHCFELLACWTMLSLLRFFAYYVMSIA